MADWCPKSGGRLSMSEKKIVVGSLWRVKNVVPEVDVYRHDFCEKVTPYKIETIHETRSD